MRPPAGVNLMALVSRFQTTCCRRESSAITYDSRSAICRCTLRRPCCLACGLTTSAADSTARAGGMASTSMRILPKRMPAKSSRSSMRWLCTRELRSMASRPCSSMAGVTFLRLSTVAQPSIAFSGLRSSCESVARNSSLIWLLRSASVRAARSLASSFSRSVTLVAMAMRAP